MPVEQKEEEEEIFFEPKRDRKHRTEAPNQGMFIKEAISQDKIHDTINTVEENKKPTILEESPEFFSGTVKYFDSIKEFGFIIPENEVKELFFHYHDVSDDRLSKEVLSLCKVGIVISVNFRIMSYMGKYQKSRKAVQVKIADDKSDSLS